MQLTLKVLLFLFLLSSMLSAGLTITVQSLMVPLRDGRLVLTALGLSFVAAPAMAFLLTLMIPLRPGHATGLLLLGCAAGAPFLPKLVEVAGGDVASSVALMTLLTSGTTFFLPATLPWLAPGLEADPWSIARPLFGVILIPLFVGLLLRRFKPVTIRWQPALGKVANVSGILMLALLIARDVRGVRGTLGSGAIASMLLFVAGIFVLGYLVGGPTARDRGLMGITSGSRNVGAALVPAAQPGVDPQVMTMLVTGTLLMILVLLAAIGWMRCRTTPKPSHHAA
jgi:BASS family bile acid:Na+ symporter